MVSEPWWRRWFEFKRRLRVQALFLFPPISKEGLAFGCAMFPPERGNEGGSRESVETERGRPT
jgi:hypothetical protein